MAESKCSVCGGSHFEVVHARALEGTTRAVLFVQCADCGAVVGALDFVNLGVQINHMKEDLQRTLEKLRAQFKS
ncbi:hypothetical protein [Acididesulfobacillus acetoxydans]|uniref:hypothetical protein n=1 Tax=Acididesulfobacillus acetoxydans TaxID=1561005 RepID=UPI001F117B05|nr:hypothetical protein [Acididesulfobacillus acetoxydans]